MENVLISLHPTFATNSTHISSSIYRCGEMEGGAGVQP